MYEARPASAFDIAVSTPLSTSERDGAEDEDMNVFHDMTRISNDCLNRSIANVFITGMSESSLAQYDLQFSQMRGELDIVKAERDRLLSEKEGIRKSMVD